MLLRLSPYSTVPGRVGGLRILLAVARFSLRDQVPEKHSEELC